MEQMAVLAVVLLPILLQQQMERAVQETHRPFLQHKATMAVLDKQARLTMAQVVEVVLALLEQMGQALPVETVVMEPHPRFQVLL
jgi:hypothetical protein